MQNTMVRGEGDKMVGGEKKNEELGEINKKGERKGMKIT